MHTQRYGQWTHPFLLRAFHYSHRLGGTMWSMDNLRVSLLTSPNLANRMTAAAGGSVTDYTAGTNSCIHDRVINPQSILIHASLHTGRDSRTDTFFSCLCH